MPSEAGQAFFVTLEAARAKFERRPLRSLPPFFRGVGFKVVAEAKQGLLLPQ